jgi:hypothetical protein
MGGKGGLGGKAGTGGSNRASDGLPGIDGSKIATSGISAVIVSSDSYVYWANTTDSDPGGSGNIYPPNEFTNSESYKYVGITSPTDK